MDFKEIEVLGIKPMVCTEFSKRIYLVLEHGTSEGSENFQIDLDHHTNSFLMQGTKYYHKKIR